MNTTGPMRTRPSRYVSFVATDQPFSSFDVSSCTRSSGSDPPRITPRTFGRHCCTPRCTFFTPSTTSLSVISCSAECVNSSYRYIHAPSVDPDRLTGCLEVVASQPQPVIGCRSGASEPHRRRWCAEAARHCRQLPGPKDHSAGALTRCPNHSDPTAPAQHLHHRPCRQSPLASVSDSIIDTRTNRAQGVLADLDAVMKGVGS